MDNPKPQAELAMLKQYGPDVPDSTLQKLVAAFGELRSMADQGTITYPYSTREVVNIVKHLQVRSSKAIIHFIIHHVVLYNTSCSHIEAALWLLCLAYFKLANIGILKSLLVQYCIVKYCSCVQLYNVDTFSSQHQ